MIIQELVRRGQECGFYSICDGEFMAFLRSIEIWVDLYFEKISQVWGGE